MPTGGGKSITFQVPALTMDGTCLVVTPLIALMKDQVRELRARGIKATAIHSDLTTDQVLAALDNCIMGSYKLLYVSPERLSSPLFLQKLAHLRLSFITIDEAHCISQWGYDFRPSYLQIANFRRLYPQVPVLALTATATPEVAEDIQHQLLFPQPNVFSMSFRRQNLAYEVQEVSDPYRSLCQLLGEQPGSAIVYMRNREKCRQLSQQLEKDGFTATFFHAGLHSMDRNQRQEEWLSGKVRVMVATNAFGMGINKPDVRLVAHLNLPDSLEEYFQEAGRAGRDGKPSRAVILYNNSILSAHNKRINNAFPPVDYVQRVYECLCFFFSIAMDDGLNVTRQFDIYRFCTAYHMERMQVLGAMDLLERAGYVSLTDGDNVASRLFILASRNELLGALTPREQTYFLALMRHYGGLFVDFVYVDEGYISRECGEDADFIYQSLSSLSIRGLVHYIPRRKIPLVTFLRRRVEKENVVLSPQMYDQRKAVFQKRLDAMSHYCTDRETCRSQLLLSYFGEVESQACGICDYCRFQQPSDPSATLVEEIRHAILRQLSSGPLSPEQIVSAPYPADTFWLVLDTMIKNEEILLKDFLFELR